MIVETVNMYRFREAFRLMDRNNFSYQGLEVLFDYLEEVSDESGEPYELDVVGICCQFAEDTWQDIAANYGVDLSGCKDDDERIEAVTDYLNDKTYLVGESVAGSFVYEQF